MRSAAPVSHPALCILASTVPAPAPAPARIHADILTVPGCCLLAGPGLISPSRCLQLCNNWRRAARAAINQNKQHKKTILDIFLSMFDSINWPHSLLKISLHYTSTQISRYLRTHGGLMIKDLLTSSATSPGRPPPGVMQHFLCDAKTVFVPPTAFFVWRGNKTNRSTARTQLLPALLLDEKYFQHERNPQSILKTIYQKTLNIVATVGLQDDRMTQYFGWRRSQFYKRSAEANIRTMRTHLRRTSSHEKYLIHTKNILHSELTWPHSLILALATCLMATLSPSLLLMPAYTIPKPPFPRTGPT